MPIDNPFCWIGCIYTGRSSSESAQTGVNVVFDKEYPSIPRISICPWQKDAVWLTEVTTAGFTWEGDSDISAIDWIAIICNG